MERATWTCGGNGIWDRWHVQGSRVAGDFLDSLCFRYRIFLDTMTRVYDVFLSLKRWTFVAFSL